MQGTGVTNILCFHDNNFLKFCDDLCYLFFWYSSCMYRRTNPFSLIQLFADPNSLSLICDNLLHFFNRDCHPTVSHTYTIEKKHMTSLSLLNKSFASFFFFFTYMHPRSFSLLRRPKCIMKKKFFFFTLRLNRYIYIYHFLHDYIQAVA